MASNLIQIKFINCFMYVLYHHFVEQIKKEEKENYNRKHYDYLVRAGKIPQNQSNKSTSYKIDPQENKDNQLDKSDRVKSMERKARRQREFQRPKKDQIRSHVEDQHNQPEKGNALPPKRRQRQFQRPNRPEQPTLQDYRQEQFAYQLPQNKYDRPIKPANFSFEQQLPNERKIDQRIEYPEPKHLDRPNQRDEKPIKVNKAAEPAQFQEVQLIQCPSGCGRKFKPQIIAKHVKVCQKVFQEKRKPFQVSKISQQAELMKKKSGNRAEQPKKQSKWKKDSENFRKILKQGRGEKCDIEIEDNRIPCPTCGRKFGQTAAARHIEFCKNKSKMKK